MTISKQSLFSIVRQVAALAALVLAYLQSTNVITGHNAAALTVVGGAILIVEHYVSDPSTGTPTPPKA